MEFTIVPELPSHAEARETLLDAAMGPIRFRRASQRLRDEQAPVLSHVALVGAEIVGTVRLWGVSADGLADALLLGPMAISRELQGKGIGRNLMRTAIVAAADTGHGAIVLVGDPSYYGQFGFSADAARRLAMPGPFERHRLLALALRPGSLDRAHGTLRPLAKGAALPAAIASAA